ncbi:MAG: RrF2 family transcriptional regulator [Thermodesulfobacteriota bacterium]
MHHNLRISEAASLALHAMALLAGDERRSRPTREMAEVLKVSDHHLAKVMQRLGRAGLVESQRGPRGGFRLARRRATISLLEVYEAVEGPLPGPTCLLGRPACQGPCALGGLLQKLGDDVKGYLARTTLGDLAAGLG